MTLGAALLVISLAALAPPPPPDAGPGTRLTLRNGTVYILKEPPRITGTRVVFTTADGRLLSLDESEIQSIGSTPAPTPSPKRYDQEDSRALGAIARQQRDATGRRAEVAPTVAPAKRAAKPPRTKTKPANGKAQVKGKGRAKKTPGGKPAPTPSPAAR